MKFIKKNGKTVSFEPSKIKTSVENAGSDIGIQLNSKELDLIISDVESILVSLSREVTTGYEVRSIVVDVLIKYGYKFI